MTKKVLTTLAVLAVLLAPRGVLAQQYGQGVVLGEEAPEVIIHEPVDAALGDISPALLGGGLLLASGILLYFSRRTKAQVSFEIK
ncbi:hypothetical protein IID21_03260 [Patescibacteria group bacterium]|nr:hypothetical protein [Patescibacteria group bacterium]